MRGREERSVVKSIAVCGVQMYTNNSRAFPHARAVECHNWVLVQKLRNSEVWAKLSSHSTIPGSSRAALLPAASSRETCACPSLRSDLRALVTSTSLWCAARGGRVGLRCFSHSGVITNKHWHKLHG